ncbi:MAG: T9SS type A sorting domain-containing protein [Bacteroidetes bacterium]|jgi:hypothetical protein|nr:T9SS type A sorting domain-containing protein [Bacteroidota bacterium]
MIKNLLLGLSILFFSLDLIAQNKSDLAPCGTISYRSDWLKNYQRNPSQFQTENDTILYVPLTIHLVGSDAGTGYFGFDNLMDALCILNSDFEQANIHFFTEGDIRYIANSAWNTHSTVLDGAEMMFANNVDNTLNCYFVSDPAGNCGYNLPYAGMAMSKSCSGASDHTWSHEMGHALSLPHPFLGWEGGISHDGSVPHSYNNPAPEKVTYNYTFFKDTLILDTIIIDTTYVEKIDGSNCTHAADGFCDTKPDYLNYRWSCDADSLSTVTQTDPNGVKFISDGKLIMSYSIDNCVDRFSFEQIGAMRANLLDEKANVLYNQMPIVAPDGPPVALYPLNDDQVPFEDITLEWEPVAGAAGYVGTVRRLFNNSSFIVEEFETTETSINIGDLSIGKEYSWEVTAYNNYHFCEDLSELQIFQTADVSGVGNIEGLTDFSVYPTLMKTSSTFTIYLNLDRAMDLKMRVYSVVGRVFFEQNLEGIGGLQTTSFDLPDLNSGVYFVGVESEFGRILERVIVQ